MDSLNQEIKIKIKNSPKLYNGILHAIDPFTMNLIIQNFVGVDEKS
jgi:small nuclear ribonucleoprotein (snRNP)-like protein